MNTKTCPDCGKELPITEFYNGKGHQYGKMCYCKSCFNIRCTDRWTKLKIKAIEYKGSQCVHCGLSLEDSHLAVFEFHHTDPSLKEFNWTKLRLRSWKCILTELDKCELLCANCHRMAHVNMRLLYPAELFPHP